MKRRASWLPLVAGLVVLGGCGDGRNDPNDPNDGDVQGETRSALRTLGDEDAFFAELRGALSAQRGGDSDLDHGGAGESTDDSADTDGAGEGAAGAPIAEGDASTADSGSDGGEEGPLEVTETNVQERGVDEQDRVKVSADGTRLYVLHDRYEEFDGVPEPVIVEDTETGEPIEIEPGDLYPYPGRGPRTTLRVLGLDAQAIEATALRDIELDLGGRGALGMYLHESESGSDVLLVSSGGGYWGGYWDQPTAFGELDSVITRIDVDEPTSAAISGSFRVDGQIVSSRRIGKHLFFASRFYPVIPGPQPWEVSAEEWRTVVEQADLESLLPRYANDDTGETTALVDPAGCFVAPRPPSVGWYTPDIVTLAVIDLDTMELADSECYLGASETLYASPEAVYLATTRWDYGYLEGDVSDGVVIVDDTGAESVASDIDLVPYDPRVETDIHQFDIDGGTLDYRGSGSVRGHLGWDELRKPFRMGAKDGYLRVATVNDTFGSDVSPINLTVLAPDGAGVLTRVAEIPNAEHPEHIGKPGEQLYASRFLGDRAYLVTFLQTDPLYVVDLADPRAPRLVGELEIEGYSDYLLPIDDSHLLGIGRDAVTLDGDGRRGDGERGGFIQGIKLALFDVSDPGAPSEVESIVVGQRGTQANALYDHRGITVQRASDDHPTRVSFGIDVAGTPFPERRPSGPEALNYYSWTHTGLYGFDVHGGDGADIEWRGAMVVERAGEEDGYYGPRYYDDRAVMVNDATYYVHGPEVYAAPWSDLGSPSGPR